MAELLGWCHPRIHADVLAFLVAAVVADPIAAFAAVSASATALYIAASDDAASGAAADLSVLYAVCFWAGVTYMSVDRSIANNSTCHRAFKIISSSS